MSQGDGEVHRSPFCVGRSQIGRLVHEKEEEEEEEEKERCSTWLDPAMLQRGDVPDHSGQVG